MASYIFRQQSAFAAVAASLAKTATDVDLTAPVPPPVVVTTPKGSG